LEPSWPFLVLSDSSLCCAKDTYYGLNGEQIDLKIIRSNEENLLLQERNYD